MRTRENVILDSLSVCCQTARRGAVLASRDSRSGITAGHSRALTTALAKILVLANALASDGTIDSNAFFKETNRLREDPSWVQRPMRMPRSRRVPA